MTKLTVGQKRILSVIVDGPINIKDLAYILNLRYPDSLYTYDQTHASLRRMEDRNLVRRVEDNPIQWELTKLGRKALNEYLGY